MNSTFKKNIEIGIHVLFWLFIFSAVNVNWFSDWFDKTTRLNTPAPLSVFLFPFIFYIHALWIIPKFLNKKKWKTYIFAFILIFIVPEFLRSWLVTINQPEIYFWDEFNSRDNLILGEPNIFWMAFTFSFAYRFTKDWFIKQNQIEHLGSQLEEYTKTKSSVNQPLPDNEALILKQKLNVMLESKQVYLNQELSLTDLAKLVETTDKKLSILLNQNLQTNFYDYINAYRVAAFKKGVSEGKLNQLSVLGLAFQCGFSSKSSFYRAFKKETGKSPSQYQS
jgi:AraC-like DNA-binding protein